MKIPNSVIYVVGDVLGGWYYSHTKLNTLFGGSGFPGDPPSGNCVHKSQEWLRRANQQDERDPLELLGHSLTEFMNLGREDDSNWTKGVKRINDILSKHKLAFDGDVVVHRDATERFPPVASDHFHPETDDVDRRPPAEMSSFAGRELPHLLGREEELRFLSDTWDKAVRGEDRRAHVVSIVGVGGMGKTSLLSKWTAEQATKGWRDCEAAFAWSFYEGSKGGELRASTDLFLDRALTFFGDRTALAHTNGFEKGRRLAELVGSRRAILVLDGLEAVQEKSGHPAMLDQGVAALLTGLATKSRGLCIIASRHAILELRPFKDTTAPILKLAPLTEIAGMSLLRLLGVKGSQTEVEEIARGVGGHPLSLQLLAGYLQRSRAGNAQEAWRIAVIEIDQPFETFTTKSRAAFTQRLAETLGVSREDVRIADVRQGSCIVLLEFESKDALGSFVAAAAKADSRLLEFQQAWNVRSVRMVTELGQDHPENSLQTKGSHVHPMRDENPHNHIIPMDTLTLPNERRGLQKIAGCNNPNRSLDIVFVHGLGGDSWTTWMSDVADIQTFWPQWLAEEFPQTGIWTLGYAASGSKWREESMPLADRGNQVLDLLTNDGIGERPLVMITHSMGGIVAKQILRHAESFGVPRWERLARETKGVAFIATPHSGAHIANFAVLARAVYRTNEQVAELTAHDARLRELHGWFLNFQRKNSTVCRTYCERRVLRPEIPLLGIKLPNGVLVVDETSAEPNIAGERAIPLDEDHLSICRPLSRDVQIFKGMVRFVRDCESKTSHPQ